MTDADDIREALHIAVARYFGGSWLASEVTGIPYKTLWRNTALPGVRERTATVSLEFIYELYPHLVTAAEGALPAHFDEFARDVRLRSARKRAGVSSS